jgi:hypothetical protein
VISFTGKVDELVGVGKLNSMHRMMIESNEDCKLRIENILFQISTILWTTPQSTSHNNIFDGAPKIILFSFNTLM